MDVERRLIEESTIEAFAERHGLVMEIDERDGYLVRSGLPRFIARFKGSDTKDGSCLVGTFDDGHTEADATGDYAERLSEKLLVIGAFTGERREIQCPRFVGGHNGR